MTFEVGKSARHLRRLAGAIGDGPALDRVSEHAKGRLRKIRGARQDMDDAFSRMGRVPHGEVVRAMLAAAHRETNASIDAVLKKERARARRAARAWAQDMLDDPDAVVLDAETTGLHEAVDFLELAVVDRAGNMLFDSRVRPVAYVERPVEYVRNDDGDPERRIGDPVRRPPVRCSEGALRVHGIRDEDLKAAPSFPQVYPDLLRALEGKRVVVYNASYDGGVWRQAVERYRLDPSGVDPDGWECAMKACAGHAGEFRHGHDDRIPESFAWQKLHGSHRALGDCRATLALVHGMAGREMPGLPAMPPVNPVPLRVLYPPRDLGAGGRGVGRTRDDDWEDIPFRAVFPGPVRSPLVL